MQYLIFSNPLSVKTGDFNFQGNKYDLTKSNILLHGILDPVLNFPVNLLSYRDENTVIKNYEEK